MYTYPQYVPKLTYTHIDRLCQPMYNGNCKPMKVFDENKSKEVLQMH